MILWFGLAGMIFLGLFKGQEIVDSVETMQESWKKFDFIFKTAGTRYGHDWHILKAIALNESSLGKATSVARGLVVPSDIQGSMSPDGKSWGLMQVTLKTAKSLDPLATEEKLNSPVYSVDIAARYLNDLFEMFLASDARRLEWVVKSYNQGPGNTMREK